MDMSDEGQSGCIVEASVEETNGEVVNYSTEAGAKESTTSSVCTTSKELALLDSFLSSFICTSVAQIGMTRRIGCWCYRAIERQGKYKQLFGQET